MVIIITIIFLRSFSKILVMQNNTYELRTQLVNREKPCWY